VKKLSSIGVASVFRISLVLGAATGVLYGFMIMISSFLDRQYLVGVIAFFLAPVLCCIMIALTNALMAWIYNQAAARLGGIEIESEDI